MAKMKWMRLVTKVVVYFPENVGFHNRHNFHHSEQCIANVNGDPTSIGEMWEGMSRVTISPQAVHKSEDDDHDAEDDDHDFEYRQMCLT